MKKKSGIQQQEVFSDLRDLEKHISQIKNKKEKEDSLFYSHQIPELPKWTDKIYTSKGFKQNLYKLKCNCGEQKILREKYSGRDIRLICQHLYWKLSTTEAKKEIDNLTKLLLSSFQKNKELKLFKTSLKDEILILGLSEKSEWINIFIGKEKWLRFSFNVAEKRWAYNESPAKAKVIETKITTIINYILN